MVDKIVPLVLLVGTLAVVATTLALYLRGDLDDENRALLTIGLGTPMLAAFLFVFLQRFKEDGWALATALLVFFSYIGLFLTRVIS